MFSFLFKSNILPSDHVVTVGIEPFSNKFWDFHTFIFLNSVSKNTLNNDNAYFYKVIFGMELWLHNICSISHASHGDVQAASGQSVGIVRQTALQCHLQPAKNIHRGAQRTQGMLLDKPSKLQKQVSHPS